MEKGKDAMLINAKFTSTCPVCGRSIHVGERVSWERGHKAVHAQCDSREAVGPSPHSEPVRAFFRAMSESD